MEYSQDCIRHIRGNLTRLYCANFVGTTERTWFRWEKGKSKPMKKYQDKLNELALIRGVDPQKLAELSKVGK